MGKQGTNHTYRSKEFKLSIVKEVLGKKSSKEVKRDACTDDSLVCNWVRQYQKDGETALEPKRRPGNPYELAKAELELSK